MSDYELITCALNGEGIDRISGRMEDFLNEMNIERANILRIRLSMEEALLRWMDHFGEGVQVKFSCGVKWRRPVITLELRGEDYDPLSLSENDLGAWSDSLLANVGLTPRYTYSHGINMVQLKLPHRRRSTMAAFAISGILGLILGLMGQGALSESVRDAIVRTVLSPLQMVFFRILNAAAGPVIFFAVTASVCGVGNVATFGREGRRMLLRFVGISSLITACTTAILWCLPIFPLRFGGGLLTGSELSGFLEMLSQFFPNDILSPFVEGNSPQLIFVGTFLGLALLAAGSQADHIHTLIDQGNSLCILIADWVSRLTPVLVAPLVILGIWDGSTSLLLGIWKPAAAFAILSAIALFTSMCRVSLRFRVPLRLLWQKIRNSFSIALLTSSVDAAYGANQEDCRSLGVSRKLSSYALPLGLLVYMPAASIAKMAFVFYIAAGYGVSASPYWILTAFLLTVMLVMASAPVAGVEILTYAAIFARLGIPEEALSIAIVADILFSFSAGAVNQAMLQMEMVMIAGDEHVLHEDVLRREPVQAAAGDQAGR